MSELTSELSTLEEGKKTTLPQISVVEVAVSPSILHKIIGEIVGTYIFIFVGCGSILIDKTRGPITPIGVPVAWGLSVLVMIYTLGHISGAHFNPAVTIAFAAFRRFPWKEVPAYVASQIFGSTLASLTLLTLFHEKDVLSAAVTQLKQTNALEAIIWEFITSFILMFVVSGVATDHRATNELAGLAVGATILLDVLLAGPVTGASMNPARSIGPAIASGKFDNLWLYITTPVMGTLAGAGIYCLLRLPDKKVIIKGV